MNKKNLTCLLTLLISFSYWGLSLAEPSVSAPTPTMNLTCAKKQVMAYYDDLSLNSGFINDTTSVMTDAKHYLDSHVQDIQNPAIIFDIDDTVISNYPEIKKNDFAGTPALIEENYRNANAPAIQPVEDFFQYVIKEYAKPNKEVTIFFITSRKQFNPNGSLTPDLLKSLTANNLSRAGYHAPQDLTYKNLYLPQNDELNLSATDYKTKIRNQIVAQGYHIVLNIGDQDSDFTGPNTGDHQDRVPNYLYSTSETPCDNIHPCH